MSACHKRGRKRPANVRGSSKGGNAWEMRIEEAARREALQPNTPRGLHDIKTLQRRQRRFNRAFHGQRRKSEWYCRECWKSNWLRIRHCRECGAQRTIYSLVVKGWTDLPDAAAHRESQQRNASPSPKSLRAQSLDSSHLRQQVTQHTPLQEAQLTLEDAITRNFPEETLQAMRAHVERLEAQKRPEHRAAAAPRASGSSSSSAQSIGQRLDMAKQARRVAMETLQTWEARLVETERERQAAEAARAEAEAALAAVSQESALIAHSPPSHSEPRRKLPSLHAALHRLGQQTQLLQGAAVALNTVLEAAGSSA